MAMLSCLALHSALQEPSGYHHEHVPEAAGHPLDSLL
jgi:hypothetical protein